MSDAQKSKVYFADIAVKKMESSLTLPAKFKRMLKRFDLPERVAGKKVAIKMHFGGNLGYTTIPPLFVRMLVDELKEAGAASIKALDSNPENGIARGYVREVIGCDPISAFGTTGNYLYPVDIGFKQLDRALFGGEAYDCDFFIDLSHIKGHGACGFGGALKNIAMGVVPSETRGKIHSLEGGIDYDAERCNFCLKCFKECPNSAIQKNSDDKTIGIFFHNCTYCQHCIMVCPEKALVLQDRKFEDFATGMALVTQKFLEHFDPENLLFINVLLNITIYCDCWGLSTASLVPDIGILASDDIIAVENASLDLVKEEDLIPKGLPAGRELRKEGKHLFEKIHGKNPYTMVDYLQEYYGGSKEYDLEEIH